MPFCSCRCLSRLWQVAHMHWTLDGPIKEEVPVAAIRADVVTDQIGAFADVLAANAGEAGRDQRIPPNRPPLCRLVPLAPRVDAIARTGWSACSGSSRLQLAFARLTLLHSGHFIYALKIRMSNVACASMPAPEVVNA